MNEDHQTQKETHKIEHYEDEIELIDYLRVIWKWKHLIIVGTVVCGVIAAIISLNMNKIYSIGMVLRPGILSIGEQGKNVYIDTPQNIKALIDSGTFNNDILSYLNDSKMDKVPKRLNFKVTILKGSDTIKIQYETANTKQGIIIQNRLNKLLLEMYTKLVRHFKNEYDMKLSLLKSETDYIKTAIQSYKRNVKNIEKRIDELVSEIELIKNNTANLIKERNKLLSKNPKESNILSALLYSNTIQQNLELSNNYQNEINDYKLKREEEAQKIEGSENKIAEKSNEIVNLQFKKDNIQNIQILQPPTSSPNPIKPKTKLNIILALVVGLFIMLFLAFFLEYLSKHKKIVSNK
jgi:capsular polysaccharide biosynthesis protein